MLFGLAIILISAKIAGHIATRLGAASVLGELIAGIVLGNASLFGIHLFDFMAADQSLAVLAELGVILLLFEVGLESTVDQMLTVGTSAALVAVIGVVLPFGFGFVVSAWLLPTHSALVHVFVGATLSATSVGITARVLQDIGQSQSPEARVILGAAVIDDVLGLVILAVVTGIIAAADTGTSLAIGDLAITLIKALGFLVGALVVGRWISPRLFTLAAKLRVGMALLGLALGFCFAMAYGANLMGLAPIVGAFAAGLVLEGPNDHALEQQVKPVTSFLAPIFFVSMGMRTDLHAFGGSGVIGLAFALTVVAIVGKIIAGFGARGAVNRLAIGIGMIPRGEVGLIFASIGAGLTLHGERIIDGPTFSAVVVMVMLTTLVTPPVLSAVLRARGPSQLPG